MFAYYIGKGKGLEEPMGHIMIENNKFVEQHIGQDSSLLLQKWGKCRGSVS
jgi:hypothetical protein